ncbi:MAG: tetratricopeptide repeat-containing sulfotransferase family protein [Opitutales bacterium]
MSEPPSIQPKDWPPTADVLKQAKTCIQASQFSQAERAVEPLMSRDLDPDQFGEACYIRAIAQRYQQAYDRALDTLNQLLERNPGYGRAYQEQGYNLANTGRKTEAAEAFARAVDCNPGLLPSWQALAALHAENDRQEEARFARAQADYLEQLPPELQGATDLMHEGRLKKAEQLCRGFLQQHKQHIEGMRLLAEIGIRLKVYDDAEFLLESAVAFDPKHLGARMDYLKVLNRKGKFQPAREQAEILLKTQPNNPAFQLALANALTGLGEFEEGIRRLRGCLDTAPDKAGVLVMLGHAEKAVGNLDAAIDAYQRAFRLKPDYGDAYWSLANTKTYRFADAELERMREQIEHPDIDDEDRAHLCFAAGKAYEDRQAYEDAFRFYRQGNALKTRRSGYSPDKTEAMVDRQIEVCTEDLFADRGGLGCDAPDPIFILGLPRAGSTLLEQILASHPQVDGTMELHNILGLAQRLRGRTAEQSDRYPQILRELKTDYFRRFGEQFIEQTRVYRGKAPYFIDKMPNNFLHIGLIRLILPKARIIDARRHPMACCFSGYKQLFGEGQDFTYDLAWAGRYYKDYVRLMDHWDRVLPGFVLRVQHEDVIEDLEGQVRRMLDFCGLPFDAACVDFHKTKRTVRTPSSEQVRQPINRSGVDVWKHFEPWLDPLKEALGPDVRQRYGLE